MTKRTVLLASGSSLLLGIAIGYAVSWPAVAEPSSAGSEPAADAAAEAVAQLAELRKAHQELRAKYEKALVQRDAERQRIEGAETQHDPQPGASTAGGAVVAAIGDVLTVSFGAWADEPALRTADWVDMGIRAGDLVRARSAGIGGGQPAEMVALEKKAIRELSGHLDRIQAEREDLGGHPIVVVNLMASHLQQAGRPLQPWQIEAIESKGREYEVQAERLRNDLSGSDTLASEKKLRSIQLRKGVVDEIVSEVLTREQWNTLFDAETKGLLYYDVYQVGGLELERPNSSVYWRNVRADAVEHLKLFLLTEWELSRQDMDMMDGLVEQWIDRIMAQPKVPGHPTSALHIDEVLPCAQVHVEFQKRVMGSLASSDRVESIRENAVFAVFPRLRSQR